MRDSRYAQITGPQGFGDGIGGWHPTEEQAYDRFMLWVAHGEQIAGRPLTRREVLVGVSHPQPSRSEQITAATRRQRELNPPVAPPTVAEQRLKNAQQREEQSLPRERQAVLAAEREVQAERAAKARQDALAQLLSSPKAVKTLATIDRLSQLAMYNSSIPQYVLDELAHQRQMLLTFGDADVAATNVQVLQNGLLDAAQAFAEQAREHADRATQRRDALLAGRDDWDSPPVIREDLLGGKTATMTFAGQSVTVPADQFTGRTTGELLARHFGVTVPVTE